MRTAPVDIDVLIFGGGVAGLWTLRRLLTHGYAAALVERASLGAGQTIASQGIIHGGLKYSLGGAPTPTGAAGAISRMPERWRACLEGSGEIDLREAQLLSPRQHLFTAPGFAAKIAGAAASKVIRTEVARLNRDERPPGLAGAPASCDVYRVDEPVLEPRSLLTALASGARRRLARLPARVGVAFAPDRAGVTAELSSPGAPPIAIRAAAVVLAAGGGNEALLQSLAAHTPPEADPGHVRMQRRPLHMVMARSTRLPPVWAHCVGASPRPLLTITTQLDAAARTVWYIGGELAERGVERSQEAQIAAARADLARLMPWTDLNGVEFATLRIDRAEGLTRAGARPDEPVVASTAGGRVLAAWPTKLAFGPRVAEMVEERLRDVGVAPRHEVADRDLAAELGLAAPQIAALPWEREGVLWS